MRLLLVLLFVFAPRASADPPFLFKLVPDGPPYPLLDLPLTSNSPPFPRSIDIHEIPTSETLRFNTGNLFVQILDNSSTWSPAHAELQVRAVARRSAPRSQVSLDPRVPDAAAQCVVACAAPPLVRPPCPRLLAPQLPHNRPSYSAPLFNLSLSQADLAELSDDAAAAGSREMCLFEVSVTTFASDLKCFARPPLHLHHNSPACFLYMAPLRDFPFVFDPALNAGGALVAGELYSVSSHITVVSVSFPGRPKLHLSQELSSFSCESFVMFRRRVSFAYLVQAEGDFNDSVLRGDDAVVLQLQWRSESLCHDASCVFFPNSTVNEGRNHLVQQLTRRFPHLHPNFIIFMDEDARLLMRGDDAAGSSSWRAHREFERLLLQWQPAIGVPYHSWHSLQHGAAVQTVDHFDHIVVALHDEVVDFYLPTETRFDSICWWHGQAVYSIISSMLFPNNTLQFNTIVSVNTGARALSLEGVAHASSKYKKRTDFYPALMWILSSAKSLALLHNVDITVDASLFTYGTLANKGNR